MRASPNELPIRRSSRVVLLDDRDRLLLFSAVNPDGGCRWFTVGGGVKAGETDEQAAHRELREETGLAEAVIGPLVWRGRPWTTVRNGTSYEIRQHYFLARVSSFDVDVSGFEPLERSATSGHRWWTAEELAMTTDVLRPTGLPELLRDLLTKGPPGTPIVVDG